MLNFKKTFLLFILAVSGLSSAWAQTTLLGQDTARRVITTAVPFLSIALDARSTAMGDVGVAISPDANSVYWNPAKLSFAEDKFGLALSYSPWLRNIINDMFLASLAGFYKLDNQQALGFEFRYFNLGSIEFTNSQAVSQGTFQANELALGLTYSRKLSKQFGAAISGRFIYSNLSDVVLGGSGQEAKPGITGAADVAFFYTNKDLKISGRPATLNFGANISNIGAKISYVNSSTQDFIPTNLRLGGALTTALDPLEKNSLTVALDFNKLMVPSPPQVNSKGEVVRGDSLFRQKPLLSGMFGSFGDAPDGLKEELQEVGIAFGLEYWYVKKFAVRAGYFNEHKNKGNRKYFTIGAGIKSGKFGLDVSYLIPSNSQNNPLAETLRLTLSLNFSDKNQTTTPEETEVN
jgi:hypothetical protein